MPGAEELQRAHYNRIATEYAAHYDDPTSRTYRERFLYEPLFREVPLKDRRVLEAMAGSGQTTEYLLSHGAQVTGLDISEEQVAGFRMRWPGCEMHCASILDTGLPSESFDGVVVVGGLHHLHPNVDAAVQEIHRLLTPKGFFCFGEPHSASWVDLLRRVWYRFDRFFEQGEAAIDLDLLMGNHREKFEFRATEYVGNLAYLLLLNSLIFRIPLALKPRIAGILMSLEQMIGRFQGKRTSCFALCHWEKR